MPPSPISSWRTSSTLFSCIGGRPRRTGTSIHRTSAEGRRGSHVGTGGAIPDDSAVTHSGGAVGAGLWAFSRGLLDPRPAPSVGVAAVAACSTHGPTDALGAGVKAHSRIEKDVHDDTRPSSGRFQADGRWWPDRGSGLHRLCLGTGCCADFLRQRSYAGNRAREIRRQAFPDGPFAAARIGRRVDRRRFRILTRTHDAHHNARASVRAFPMAAATGAGWLPSYRSFWSAISIRGSWWLPRLVKRRRDSWRRCGPAEAPYPAVTSDNALSHG